MAARDIQPLEPFYTNARAKNHPATEIPDRRGPLVYDLTFQESLNGVNPDVYGKPNKSEEK